MSCEVERLVGDVVAVLDEADVLAAALVVGGRPRCARRRRRWWRRRRCGRCEAKNSACLVLGCRITCARPVSGSMAAGAALVGVAGADHREGVGLRAVARGQPGLQRALAAGRLREVVRVLVVAERDLDHDVGAVDAAVGGRAVLGVGDRDLVRDLVGEATRAGRRSACSKVIVGARLPTVIGTFSTPVRPGLVRDRQLGREGAVGRVGVRRVGVGRVDVAVAVEVPGVGDRAALGVVRAGAVELHGQRREAGRRRRRSPSAIGALSPAT